MERKSSPLIVSIVIAFAGFAFFAHAQSVGVTLPSVPTGMTVTVVPPAQASLSWSASAESAGTIEGYYIYRNGSQIGTTAGTSFIDSNLSPGYYGYTVAAYDESGIVSQQSTAATVTLIADNTPPSTPAGLAVSGVTSTNSSYAATALTISWGASTDNVGVAGYYVYRNGVQIVSSTSAFTGTSYVDSVVPGSYTYTVVAYDAAQNFSNHSASLNVTVGVDNAPPSVPVKVSVSQSSATGVNLSWAPSTAAIGITGYQVFRDGTQIATVTGSPYADSGLSTGVEYAYAVTAFDAVGNISGKSTPVAITLQALNGPGVPYILSAFLVGTSTVHISWGSSGDVLMITGYNVYRDANQIATVTSTDYFDFGVPPGFHTYTLSATDASGAVSAMSSMNITVPVITTSSITAVIPPIAVPLPVVVLATPSTAPAPPVLSVTPNSGTTFTQFLYFGLRNPQVGSLQSLLAQNGYLSSANATEYFGSLTLGALEKFQCDKNIVCTGGAGWGTVGPKTRSALNALGGGGGGVGNDSNASASLAAEIQTLEAELTALEAQTNH